MPHILQPHLGQAAANPLLNLRLAETAIPKHVQRKGYVFLGREGVEKRRALKQHPELAPDLAQPPIGNPENILPVHPDRSPCRV